MKKIEHTALEEERAALVKLKAIYQERLKNVEERIKEIDNIPNTATVK